MFSFAKHHFARSLPGTIQATLVAIALMIVTSGALAEDRPNFVVIMVDDLGFSDIGCYGSEIETPNLDALANNGVRFSQFYNTAKCHSSRVCLLTGQYCIAAGDTKLSHAVTSAEVLSEAGYFTAMTGKWHLDKQPTDFGFQKYFGHLSGACNYFSGDGTFRLNGQPWKVPAEGFYTTVANVDYGLKFLKEARTTQKPWYLYVAFNAPHAPLHALPQDYARYKGKYSSGWDAIRDARLTKQKKLGILPASLQPSPRPEHIPAWENLEQWKQDYEANRMTTLAAMIDRVDKEVGRLVADLKKNNELENTFILFVSDNGACPYDRKPARLDVEPTNANTFFGDSTGWAWARNSPFRYYKQNQFEGGISTPAILHWPAGLKLKAGSIVNRPSHLIDVLPTMADLAETTIPDAKEGRELRPVSGVSLKPILQGATVAQRPPIHFVFSADRGLRDGDWKLVSFQGGTWELYNVASDRAELNNLAKQEPERLESMIAKWHDMAANVLHAPAGMRAPVKPATLPHRHREWTNFAANTPAEYRKKSVKNTRPIRTARRKGGQRVKGIRARKNTKLTIVGNELRLLFSGEDPGLAMDLRSRDLDDGPYQVSFQLKVDNRLGKAVQGEVFYTTDRKTTLPKGTRITFPIQAKEAWQAIAVKISEPKRIYQLRIDIGEGSGAATIADLQLLDSNGNAILKWPTKPAALIRE